MYGESQIGPLTEEFLSAAKRTCTYHSYGEFEGLRDPSIGELYVLRGLLEAALYEKTKNEHQSADM